MRCTNPLSIVKDGSGFRVPCGRCIACRLNHNNSWAIRIYMESRTCKYSSFLTLTYDDKHLTFSPTTGNPTLSKRDAQLFFKRLRKQFSFRYFLGGEYGGIFGRPHLHACVFSNDSKACDRSVIEKAWQNGFVRLGELTLASARYIAKYTVSKVSGELAYKKYIEKGIEPEFALMSRHPGIGQFYIDKYKDMLHDKGYVVVSGRKQPLPRFVASKIFSDDEKSLRFTQRSIDYHNELNDSIQSHNFSNIYDAMSYSRQEDSQRDINLRRRLSLKGK